MKSMKELRKSYENERQVFVEHEIFKRQPVTVLTGFVTSLIIVTSNFLLYPVKYVYYYYIGSALKHLNRTYFKGLIENHERTHAEIEPEEL